VKGDGDIGTGTKLVEMTVPEGRIVEQLSTVSTAKRLAAMTS
jgi:hypothetical protein